jgi:hypothetical protein
MKGFSSIIGHGGAYCEDPFTIYEVMTAPLFVTNQLLAKGLEAS